MEKYRLDLILEAARFFAQEDGAVETLAADLRYMQSQINKSKPEDVKEVSHTTFVSIFSGLTANLVQLKNDILLKYEEIRTAD